MHRLNELEGARGLLAVWVVVVHLIPAVGFDAKAFGLLAPLFSDHIRVKIFCAMSGFVIFIMLERKKEPYLDYITKRFMRLFPAYLVFFLLSVALVDLFIAALEGNAFNGQINLRRLSIFASSVEHAPGHILAHATMFHALVPQSILPQAPYAFLGQAWNLTYEWVFYLCAPLLFWIASRNRKAALGGAILYLCIHFLLRSFVTLPLAAQYVSWFIFGMLSYYVWLRFRTTGLDRPVLWGGIAALALYAVTREMAIVIWVALFVAILGARREGAGKNLICTLLTTRPMLYLGRISYSIYLCHMIPVYVAMYCLNQWNHSHVAYTIYLVAATSLGTLGISVLAYRYLEEPAIRLGQAIVQSQRFGKLRHRRFG